jgi:hypothetical protein
MPLPETGALTFETQALTPEQKKNIKGSNEGRR